MFVGYPTTTATAATFYYSRSRGGGANEPSPNFRSIGRRPETGVARRGFYTMTNIVKGIITSADTLGWKNRVRSRVEAPNKCT